MKGLGLTLIAALAVGCSSSPTSPSAVGEATSVIALDVQPGDHAPGTTKVTVYFYSGDLGHGGSVHVTGMPVRLASEPGPATYTGTTGKQGSISIDVSKTSTAVLWTVLPNALGFCVATGTLNLPYSVRANWFPVHREPSCVAD
jgi:hypothetical protein